MSHHPTSRRTRLGAVAALGAAALVAAAPVARADKPLVQHFRGEASHVEQEVDWCTDVPFSILHEFSFNFVVSEHVRNGTLHFRLGGNNVATYTNLDTGTWLRAYSSLREQDQRIVDNGDGTMTIRFRVMSQDAYHSPDGALVAKSVSNPVFEVVIDHGGTLDDPSDDTFVSESAGDVHGVDTLGGRVDCDIAAEYLA